MIVISSSSKGGMKVLHPATFTNFIASVQLFFIGLIGEYVGAILTQVKRRPLVIEKERINF